MPITPTGRAYVAGKYALEIDGNPGGWIQSVDGGHASSDVVLEKIGPDGIVKKHIGSPKYEDISVSCGTGMSRAFYQWINDSFNHKYTRKQGAVITADYDYQEMSRLSFYNALISEIGFPALDAGSKDAAKLTVKFKPEYTRMATGGGASIAGRYPTDQKIQKKWLPANFRLRIDNTDCTGVNKIEAITVKQKNIENPTGEKRDAQIEPAHLEIPNLVITTDEAHAREFYDWHRAFVIDGKNGDDQERGGTLEYMDPSMTEVLFTVTFQHLGIFKVTPEKVEAGSENVRRVKIEMYCEDMKFDYRAAWA